MRWGKVDDGRWIPIRLGRFNQLVGGRERTDLETGSNQA